MSQEKHITKDEEGKKKSSAEHSRIWRAKNLEKAREVNRRAVAKFRRLKAERMNEIQRQYWDKNPEKYLEKCRRYQNKYPKKLEAQKLVNLAIKQGKLKRLPCQHCGNPKSEGHHADYSKPLDVQWLCKKHHVAWHKLFTAVGGE